jgi:hypothetical protein
MSGVQKFLPLALAGLFQRLGRREALHKHPRTDQAPVLKATVFFLASFLGVGHGSTPALRASKKPA